MRLDEAVAVKVGSQDVAAVYVGDVQVWPTGITATIDNAGGAAKADWPVRVVLTADDLDFGSVAADGSSIAFRLDDVPLTMWREAFDQAAETAALWVVVPSIPADGPRRSRSSPMRPPTSRTVQPPSPACSRTSPT